jgi:hypothetical protein
MFFFNSNGSRVACSARSFSFFASESSGLFSNGQFQFNVVGDPGSRVEIQATTDFSNCASFGIITNLTRTVSFADSEATNFYQRFYRAVSR